MERNHQEAAAQIKFKTSDVTLMYLTFRLRLIELLERSFTPEAVVTSPSDLPSRLEPINFNGLGCIYFTAIDQSSLYK